MRILAPQKFGVFILLLLLLLLLEGAVPARASVCM